MPRAAALAVLLALVALAPRARSQQVVAPPVPEGFALAPAEEAYLDQVLQAWEAESGKIQTFSCTFTRMVYDHVFGPAPDPNTGQRVHVREEQGELSYQRPDKGRFEITGVRAWDAQQQTHVENANIVGEKWVCDGKAVYQYVTEQKQLKVRPIPPEMQGESIVDGPLPFLFGAEAEKLKRRYWLRLDPRGGVNGEFWLIARPKYHQDAANYSEVELMLDRKRLLPTAIKVTAPDGSPTVYAFDAGKAQINTAMARIWGTLFSAPRTPMGWKRVVEQPGASQAAAPSMTR